MLSSAFVVTTHLIFIIEEDGIPLRDAASTTACSNHVLSSLSFAFTNSFFFCGESVESALLDEVAESHFWLPFQCVDVDVNHVDDNFDQ